MPPREQTQSQKYSAELAEALASTYHRKSTGGGWGLAWPSLRCEQFWVGDSGFTVLRSNIETSLHAACLLFKVIWSSQGKITVPPVESLILSNSQLSKFFFLSFEAERTMGKFHHIFMRKKSLTPWQLYNNMDLPGYLIPQHGNVGLTRSIRPSKKVPAAQRDTYLRGSN